MIYMEILFPLFLALLSWNKIQCADNNLIEPKKISSKFEAGDHGIFKFMSIVVEAKPKPKVYGCSYLKGDNPIDDVCLAKLQNGELQPLVDQTPLLNKFPDSEITVRPNEFWYLYEPPTSCWRSHQIYATIDNQNYTRLDHVDGVKWAPQVSSMVFNETSQCLSIEVKAFEEATACDFDYKIELTNQYEIEAKGCVCYQDLMCCYRKGGTRYLHLDGAGTSKTPTLEFCYGNDVQSEPIRRLNSTFNNTEYYARFGLYTVTSTYLEALAQVVVQSRAVFGPKSDVFTLPLYGSQIPSPPTHPPPKEVKNDGGLLRGGKLAVIGSILVLLLNKCLE